MCINPDTETPRWARCDKESRSAACCWQLWTLHRTSRNEQRQSPNHRRNRRKASLSLLCFFERGALWQMRFLIAQSNTYGTVWSESFHLPQYDLLGTEISNWEIEAQSGDFWKFSQPFSRFSRCVLGAAHWRKEQLCLETHENFKKLAWSWSSGFSLFMKESPQNSGLTFFLVWCADNLFLPEKRFHAKHSWTLRTYRTLFFLYGRSMIYSAVYKHMTVFSLTDCTMSCCACTQSAVHNDCACRKLLYLSVWNLF